MLGAQFTQSRLFPVADPAVPKRDYNPDTWHKSPDIVWHASEPGMDLPTEDRGHGKGQFGGGFHTGSLQAAEDRSFGNRTIYPMAISGNFALQGWQEHHGPDTAAAGFDNDPIASDTYGDLDFANFSWDKPTTSLWSDEAANRDPVYVPGKVLETDQNGAPTRTTPSVRSASAAMKALDSGFNIPYRNEYESPGEVSFRSPRENLKTWSESVLSDPGASRQHKLTAEIADVRIPSRHDGYSGNTGYRPHLRLKASERKQERRFSPNSPLANAQFWTDSVRVVNRKYDQGSLF